MVSEFREPAVGDHVLVPWGLDEVEGEVVEIYRSGLGPRARVQLTDEPEGPVVTVPLDSLYPTERQARPASPIDGDRYGRLVEKAIRKVATEIGLASSWAYTRDSEADLKLRLAKEQRLLVQVKFFASATYVSTDSVVTAAGLTDRRTSVLLVANAPLAQSAAKRLVQLRKHGTRIWFVQWTSSANDEALRAVLTQLVATGGR